MEEITDISVSGIYIAGPEGAVASALKVVSDGVNALRDGNRSFLVITHYQRLLDRLHPDVVHILMDGRIVKRGGPDLAGRLQAEGYEAFRPAVAGA